MPSDLPSFLYRHVTAAEREQPKLFTDTLINTGRFWRDANSNAHFKVDSDDYTRLTKHALRELLLSRRFVRLDGDTDDAAFDTLWQWLISRLWTLPRLDPDRPSARYTGQVRK